MPSDMRLSSVPQKATMGKLKGALSAHIQLASKEQGRMDSSSSNSQCVLDTCDPFVVGYMQTQHFEEVDHVPKWIFGLRLISD